MPGSPSWNGRWSGEGRCYAILKKFTSLKAKKKAAELIAARSFAYRWDDGWYASISVKEVAKTEARQIRKASQGFCGYDWMVESILERGTILADHEIKKEVAAV
jgi:hypothetical protein